MMGDAAKDTTLRMLLKKGEALLLAEGIEEAALDARRLLLAAFDCTTSDYLLHADEPLSRLSRYKEQGDGDKKQGGGAPVKGSPIEGSRVNENTVKDRIKTYETYLRERAEHRPLQHIIGETEFMGLPFYVSENVLIPRQDTETLVEAVLEDVPEKKQRAELKLLDMCTGSGCIALSLLLLGDFAAVVGADLSEKALLMADKNAKRLLREAEEKKFYLIRSDLFRELQPELTRLRLPQRFDILTVNPPYICTDEIARLSPEVQNFEPRMALDGDTDGLLFYRRIAEEAQAFLADGARIYLEIGAEQARAVTALFFAAGYTDVSVLQDLTGKDRVVKAVWRTGNDRN